MSILKKAMQICLNLGSNEIMKSKELENSPKLKANFQNTLGMLLEGLKLFVHPLQINQLKQSTQSLIYKLIHMLYERNFGHLLTMA
jgi:hypothetical protein